MKRQQWKLPVEFWIATGEFSVQNAARICRDNYPSSCTATPRYTQFMCPGIFRKVTLCFVKFSQVFAAVERGTHQLQFQLQHVDWKELHTGRQTHLIASKRDCQSLLPQSQVGALPGPRSHGVIKGDWEDALTPVITFQFLDSLTFLIQNCWERYEFGLMRSMKNVTF